MRRVIAIGAFGALGALMPTGVKAQQKPEEVARAAIAAYERQGWDAFVRMVDLSAATAFRESELALIAAWLDERDAMRAARKKGIKSYGYSSDGVLQPEQLTRLGGVRVDVFHDAPTFAQLAALSPQAFLRQWLQAVHSSPRSLLRLTGESHRRVLGTILEGDTLAHVLYRPEGSGIRYDEPWTVEILALRKDKGVWRVLLPNRDLAWSVNLMHVLHDPGEEPLEES